MDLDQALAEVLEAAKQPKKSPPGITPVTMTGETLAMAVYSEDWQGRMWHQSLTLAQETVCRWIWETCAQHYQPWEQFEFGFLCEYNTDHELAAWTRITRTFDAFIKRYRSADKRVIIGELRRLSAGARLMELKGGRAKELTELWKQGSAE